MAQAPAYQMYAADFAMTTTGWPSDSVAAHIRFMNSQWINGGLPADTGELAAIAGLTKKKFAEAWKWLEKRYPVCSDGMRRNPRLEIERLKQQQYREKQANAAAMRWHKQAPSQSDALQSSSSTTTTTSKSKATTAREAFDGEMWMRAIFNAHPRPEWGQDAMVALWEAADDEIAEHEWTKTQACEYLMARAQLYAQCVKGWPRSELHKANGTRSFFKQKIYRQDDALWRRTNGERKAQTQQDQQRDELRELVVGDPDGQSHLETTIPKLGLLPDTGAKTRSTGGLVSISSTDRDSEIH